MKVTREKTENSQAFLSIELEPAEVEDALEASYRRLVKRRSVPGFRKGKAPREILERYIGKEGLLDETLNDLVPTAYQKAVEEQEIEPIARPDIEIVQTEPVLFKAKVPLRPTIELGDYRSIRETRDTVEVTEDKVDAVIEQLRHQNATWEPVERPAAIGDLLVLDIESSVDGEPFVNRQGVQFQLVPDQVFPAPGFSEQLVGMNASDEREFEIAFPADFNREEMAGKKASFKVKASDIKEEKLPEVDDEFAQVVDAEFKTADQLREKAIENLKIRAEERAKIDFEERVIQAAVDMSRVEYPPILVELEIDRLLNQQLQRLQMDEKGFHQYLENINKTEAELREDFREAAEKRVTQSLVLGKISEAEKIEVSEEEIDAEIENMLSGAGEKKEEFGKFLNNPESRETISRTLMTRKTIDCLEEIAGGEPA